MVQPSLISASILIFSAALSPSRADQPTILALAGNTFVESLTDKPRVVGNLLVGLNWDSPDTVFEPAKITIEPPNDGRSSDACLAVASQDGHYSSRNLFHIPAAAGSSAAFDYKTAERAALKLYGTSRMGVIVRMATSCDDPHPGPILPVSLRSTSNPQTALVAKINADPKDVTVQLSPSAGPSLKGQACQPSPDGTRVAFRSQCTIFIKDRLAAGVYTLLIEIKEILRSDKVSFKIQIQ